MPRIHLIQSGFTYKGYEPFTENKARIEKLKETLDISYIYQKERDKFFSIWLMVVLNIYTEEQLAKRFCVINHLILLEIVNMKNINVTLFQCFIIFLRESSATDKGTGTITPINHNSNFEKQL